jgi:HAD superfamily hydrolase (TIGR01549 family)
MRIAAGLPAAYDLTVIDRDAPPPPIRAILFDFANTLFRPIDTASWLRATLTAAGAAPDDASIAAYVRDLELAWEDPAVVAAQAGRDASAAAHRTAGLTWLRAVPALRGDAERLFEAVSAPETYQPYDDTVPVLTELAARGVPVGVVSDIAWDIRRHFAHAGISDLISGYTLSYQHGTEKPDPKLFQLACEQLEVDPRATLMVGDNPTRDGGAVRAGLRAYVLPAEGQQRIRGLDAVLRLLG